MTVYPAPETNLDAEVIEAIKYLDQYTARSAFWDSRRGQDAMQVMAEHPESFTYGPLGWETA